MAKTDAAADGQRGAIVTVVAPAFDGEVGQASYARAKAGIGGMTFPLAQDLAEVRIRVNTIAPGVIDTPIYDWLSRAQSS